MAAALPMGKAGLEPAVFTAWVADLQSAAIAAMLTCPYFSCDSDSFTGNRPPP